MRLFGIIDRPIWQPAADQAMGIVAPAGLALPRNRLSARIDAPHVRADGTAQAPGVAGAIRIHVFKVVELLGR